MKITLLQFKRFLIHKSTFIAIVTVALLTMLVGTSSYTGQITMGLVDEDQTSESKWLYSDLESIQIVHLDKSEILEALSNKTIQMSLYIPKGFSQDDKTKIEMEMVDDYGGNQGTIATINNRINIMRGIENFDDIKQGGVKDVQLAQKDFSSIERLSDTIGILMMSIMYLASTLVRQLERDKHENRIQRVLVSPIKQSHYIAQQLFAFLLVIMILIASFFLVNMFMLDIEFGPEIVPMFMVIVVFSILILLVAFIGLLVADNYKHTHSFTTLFIMVMSMLGGCFWPVSIMPSFMQYMSRFLPTYWTGEIIRELAISERIDATLPYLGALAAMTLILFIMGSTKRVSLSNK
ncbi:ABC transporter permease [Acidaminobacter sp. JC074]|uniref:ABC transporter permease n=1 Tax=Acidaminobacter sp. JC074 TaxID=2530199 RepID=UPI001F0E410B|nr:ABC transporter permease [Acidaminobacter sp. JC074]MCH4887181.1 ABC transporter permease [Acidaminobacter sp. JC074]